MQLRRLPLHLILILSNLIVVSAYANRGNPDIQSIDCIDAIIYGYKTMNVELTRDNLRRKKFSEFGVTAEEFNSLPTQYQEAIYYQIKPIEVLVEEVINHLNQRINYAEGDIFDAEYSQELFSWRMGREILRNCKIVTQD